MRPPSYLRSSKLRPLSFSLARLSSAAAVAAALLAAGQSAQGQSFWYGIDPDVNSPVAGDGILWTDPNNWTFDVLPGGIDVVFDAGLAVPGTIQLNGNQAAGKLTFNDNYALGAFGSTNVLANTGGNVEVAATKFATINAILGGTSGLNLTGGGTLFLSNNLNQFTGNISVADAGSTLLVAYPGQPTPASRSDALALGQTTRSVTLTNGGAVKFIGSSYNPDGTTKNYVFGDGGGVLNIAAGFQRMTLDDGSQIQVTGANPAFVKEGAGSVQLISQDYNLGMTGGITVNAGVLQLGRVQGNTGANRFSAFTTGSAVTVNSGGHLTLSGTTLGIFDQNLTLNAGGILSTQGADHEFGMRGQLTIGGAAISSSTLTLNGGTILARDSFDPQTQRFPRLQGIMVGSGTVTFAALGSSGGNSRMVFQRSDLPHTFNGTFVAEGNTAIELQPRNNDVNLASAYSGNTIGGGSLGVFPTIELRGFNASADIRNAGGVATRNGTNFITGWNSNLDLLHDNNIAVTGTDAGGIQRLVVTTAASVSNGGASGTAPAAGIAVSTNIAGGTGNILHFKNLSIGNNQLLLTQGNTYSARFDSLTLTGSPTFNLLAGLQIDGTVNESVTGQGIVKFNNSQLTFTGAVNLSSLDVRHGTVALQGAAGGFQIGNLSGIGAITVNGQSRANNNPLSGGVLLVNNVGGTVANRLGDAVGITLLSDATLRLASEAGIDSDETTGNVSIPFGNPNIDAVSTGATASSILRLGSAALTRGTTAVVNFTGTSLGTAGNTGRIVLGGGQVTTPFLGGWAVSGNEFAQYDATIAGPSELGVTPLLTYSVNPGEANYLTGINVKESNAAATTVTLLGARAVNSLNLQGAGVTTLDLGTNLLTVESGGLLSSNAAHVITSTAPGGLTAGTTPSAAPLFITNNGTLNLNAVIQDNAAGGSVTLVKSGTGTLILNNQNVTGHLNTMSGGVTVNNGVLNVWRGSYLGASGSNVTLAGGQLEINVPNTGPNAGLVNAPLTGFGQNVVVEGNAFFGSDNNGETAGSGTNNLIPMGSLAINGPHTLNIGGFDQYDLSFAGSTFSGTPSINIGVGRDGNSLSVIGGAQSGSGFNLLANGTAPSALVLGAGVPDVTASTGLSSAINLYGGTLRLNKMDGVRAIAHGTGAQDIIINGGTLAWGPGHVGTVNTALNDTNNGTAIVRFAGISIASQYTYGAGQHQIENTATITLLAGNLGENGRVNNEKFGTLIQKNGTLNPGLGTMEVDSWQFSGGAIAFNSGGTFRAGTATLTSGAQEINIANNFVGAQSRLEIGTGGLTLTGQSVSFGGNSYFTPSGGAVLQLGGPLTVNADPLNLSDTDRQKGFFAGGRDIASGGGRELARNVLDLDNSVRDITIAGDIFYAINTLIQNGGFRKNGAGSLAIQNWFANGTTLPVSVVAGNLIVRGADALGSSAVVVGSGGTLKLDGGWTLANGMSLSGPGALIPNGDGVREFGALVAEAGYNRVLGPVLIAGDTTIGANLYQNPSTSPTGGAVGVASPLIKATLAIESAGGITGSGNLTITGSGDGLILNGLKTSGGLKKEGAGIWTIAGLGTYPGPTTVEAGILRITHDDALGTAVGDTTVFGGNTLGVAGGITSPEPLVLHGTGFGGLLGVVNNAGNNTLTGLVTLGSDSLIRSAGGTLTLGSAVLGTDTTLTVGGTGATAINGIIATGIGALIKNDAGGLTLRGGNTFTGATSVNGGLLTLDYSASNTDKISAADLNLGGGSVSVLGNAGAATMQVVNQLNLNAGGGTVSVAGSGGQTAMLDVGAIVRSTGASVNFATASNGSIKTTEANDATGILGGYATFGGDWAEVSATKIQAYTGPSPAFTSGSAAADNALLAATGGPTLAVALHSLKVSGGSGFQTPGLALASGGLLHSGSGKAGIAQDLLHPGTGLLQGTDANADLFVHTTGGGTLSIGLPIIGAGSGSLVKSGAGTLMLCAPSSFTGNVYINGGTLEIMGPGGTADAVVLGAATKNINLNGGIFSIRGGDYDPGAGTKSVIIGAAGGGLNVGNGQLLLNDAGQFSGGGTLTKTGGGTLNVGVAGFTGDTIVQQGILRVTNPSSIGGLPGQSVSFAPNTAYVHETTTAGTYDFNGTTIGIQVADRQFLGPVNFSGANKIYLGDMIGALQNARSVQLAGPVSGNGSIELFGNNQNGRLQIQAGSNTFSGTITMNSNTGLEFRPPTSAALTPGAITVNMNGANSRVLVRHYTGGDFNLNLNVSNNVELFAGQIDNYGLGSQTLMRVSELTISGDNRLLTIAGSGSDWLTVNTAVAAAGNNTILNTTTNAAFMAGGAFGGVAGGAPGIDKRGGSVLASYGEITSVGPVIIQAGTIDLRSGGKITAPSLELRGNGSLMFSNNVAEGSDANRYTGSLTLGGGTLRVFGTTNLGTLTAVGGSNDIRYSMDTQTGYVPLLLTGITRQVGAHIQINSDFGTVGAVSLNLTNPRIHFDAGSPLDVDTFGTGAVGSVDIIPGYTNGNEFVGYRTATDGLVKIGLFSVNNNFMRLDAADGVAAGQLRSATAPNEIMRLSGTATTTLGGSATFRALKMDGGSTRTLAIGTNTLRIERGMITHVANDQRISSGATGVLTAGVVGSPAELMFTVQAGNAFVQPIIANNGAGGTVSVVKNGGGTLILEGTNLSTYTGGTFVNAGTLQVRSAARLGSATTNTITLQGGNLELQVDATVANQAVPFGHDIVVKGNGLIGADNGAAGAFIGHVYSLGKLTINGPYTLQAAGFDDTDLTFTGAVNFSGAPTIDLLNGRAGTAAGQTYTLRLAGAVGGTDGYYVTSTGGAAGTNPTPGRLFLGNGAADNVPNTNSGTLIIAAPTSSGQNTVTLDKQAGTDAVAGDIIINGGILFSNANEQIRDTSNVTVTGFASVNGNYGWNLNAKTEKIASLTMNGGLVTTGVAAILNVSGNVTLNGTSSADGLQINSGTSLALPTLVTVGGALTVNEFGRAVMGAAFTALEVGSLTLNGGTIQQNTGGNVNNLRLNGNVTATSTTFAPANIAGNTDDTDTYLDLRGTRTFNIAKGPHGIDLIVGSVIQDGPATGIGATGGSAFGVGKIVKTGAGVMSIQNTNTAPAAASTFTGGVEVQDGTLELARAANNNTATGTGPVTIGDGIGAAGSAIVRLRNNEQIANASAVTINGDGLLDLDFGCATETIGSLNGSTGGMIVLSPSNTLIVTQSAIGTYSGEIHGAGSVVKNGAAKLVLDGILDIPELRVDGGRLDLATALGSGSSTLNANANTETNISVSQTLGELNIGANAVVTLGSPLPPAPAGDGFGGIGGDDAGIPALGADFGGAGIPVQGVPEPGTAMLLLGGLATMLGFSRRRTQ